MELVSDDELVFLARQHHQDAIAWLFKKMQNKQDRLIYKMMAMHLYCGLDYDDLKMVALQSLYLAIDSYHPHRNQFDAYYHFLLQREVVNELKRFASVQHAPITHAYSLDYEIEEGTSMAEMIGEEDGLIKSRLDDPFYQLLESQDHHLSPQERAILIYVKAGYSYREIGSLMHRSYRQISRIVQQLLKKTTTNKTSLYY